MAEPGRVDLSPEALLVRARERKMRGSPHDLTHR
jgi:hypothetical protein